MNALERLTTELSNLKKDRKFLFTANPTKSKTGLNLMKWECSFPGPDDPLYKDSYYYVTMEFTNKYPFSPPKVKFKYDVFHPNIYQGGDICLDVLAHKWKPSMTIMQVLSSVQRLLVDFNVNSPANQRAHSAFKKGVKVYGKLVRENIEMFHCLPPLFRK